MEDDWVHSSSGPRTMRGLTLYGQGTITMATISDAGAVTIDWARVEATAADPDAEKVGWQFAKLLLAARGPQK
jgi:hypothetical protein